MANSKHPAKRHPVLHWAVILSPLLIILIYILMASYRLRIPGTQYDEALYLNAALGGVDKTTFITKSFHNFPILLMPYIGALKSYIFFPIFKLFGVSPITMRLPVIFLTAGSLYLLYWLLREQVGKFYSLLILFLTAIDVSFIFFTRLDNGPVVLDFLIKIIAIFTLLKFQKNKQLWLLGIFWLGILAGEFNKLNFIWYANAFLAAFVLVYGRRLWSELSQKDRWRAIIISAIGYSLVIFYYLYITITYKLGRSFGFVGWRNIYNNLAPLISGNWLYYYVFSTTKIGTYYIFWIMSAVILAGFGCYLYKFWQTRKLSNFDKFYGFTSLMLVLILMQLAITQKATAGWHYFSVYPFFGIVFILSLVLIIRLVPKIKLQPIERWIVVIIVGIFSLYQLSIYRQYIKAFNKPTANIGWTTAIYSLNQFAESRPKTHFISLDWGLQTQLLGFDPVANKYIEVFGPVDTSLSAHSIQTYNSLIANQPRALYVTHPINKEIFPEVTSDFFKLAQAYGYHPNLVAVIKDQQTTVFEIYSLSK